MPALQADESRGALLGGQQSEFAQVHAQHGVRIAADRILIDAELGLVTNGAVTTEEQIGHWSAACYNALTGHYGFDRDKATYFATHVEADLAEHEEGVMGHASFNRMALQRLLETGMADERPTYGIEYSAMTSVDLHGVMLRAAMEEAERRIEEARPRAGEREAGADPEADRPAAAEPGVAQRGGDAGQVRARPG